MINTEALAKDLSQLMNTTVCASRETWSFVTHPGITRIEDEYKIWVSSSGKLHRFIGPQAVLNFVKHKKILFRKFNVATFKK